MVCSALRRFATSLCLGKQVLLDLLPYEFHSLSLPVGSRGSVCLLKACVNFRFGNFFFTLLGFIARFS